MERRHTGASSQLVRRLLGILACAGLTAAAACKPEVSQSLGTTSAQTGAAPAGDTGHLAADDGQWVRPAKDYASTRFSALSEINTANVKNLRLVATFSTGVLRGHEAAPIVVGSTMYVITPFPNYVYALDLTKPGLSVKWTFNPKPELAAQGVACCDLVNRGLVYDAGKLFFNTLDDHTIALDAESGKVVWDTKVGDINLGETMTMAPLVVKGHVLVGDSGGEMGVRGWLKGLDENSGKVVWTAYHTGPDKDVLIGPGFKAFYAKDQGKDLGVSSWPPDMWKIGGGTMWGWISYDSTADLIFYGSGNPGPWNPEVRPGDNKWASTLFARRPETGEAVWAYQLSQHDLHDYDGVNEQILVDLPIGGVTRKVLIRPERNGYIYVMDRATGEVISANAYGFVNASTGVDLKTGALQYNPEKETKVGKVVREICPAAPGMKDWQPTAYSPRTGMLYIPHQNLCMDEEGVSANYIAGTPYVGMNVKMYPGPGGNRGEFEAWNPVTGKQVWAIKEDLPVWSGTVVTAGDVAFYGTMDGWFKAVDARNGAVLWQFKTGSGIIGQPITYKGPDGHQYVAVLSGVGGWSGAIVAGGLDARDSSAALGMVNAMRDLPSKTTKGGMLYVFGL
ncbi:MAG: PQQ-dependent dehydrogenase, methanol/ethanol family [Gemmatimonadetes bacterium]|nr:PQQ-dependent dehydrogenase, methanol/ethanol family [Gemmatimonadota bacterium]